MLRQFQWQLDWTFDADEQGAARNVTCMSGGWGRAGAGWGGGPGSWAQGGNHRGNRQYNDNAIGNTIGNTMSNLIANANTFN